MAYPCTYKSKLLTSKPKPHPHSLCEPPPFKESWLFYVITANRSLFVIDYSTVFGGSGNHQPSDIRPLTEYFSQRD